MNYMELPKTQFNYYQIVWVFHSPSLNNKMNRLHECCLRIIYNDNIIIINDLFQIGL